MDARLSALEDSDWLTGVWSYRGLWRRSAVWPTRSWGALVAEVDATNAVAVALAGRRRRANGAVDTVALGVDDGLTDELTNSDGELLRWESRV